MVREMKHTEIGEIPVEWKLQTFEETFCVLSNNTLPRADLNDRGGTVRNVHYGDILTRFGEVLDCEKDEVPYLNDLSLLTASAQVLQDGDVILADTAEDDTVGKATEIYGLGKGRMVAGLHTIPCRVKKGAFVPKWLGYYMNSPIYHDQVLPYVTGIKVSSISKAAISGTLIAVPPLEEQRSIVSALSEVEQLLAELKKVVSKLRDFKRGCLYLMFPQEGSDIPQMREPGYVEPWEQRKAVDIAEYSKGNGYSKSDLTETGTPIILYGRLYTKYQFVINEVDTLAVPKEGAVYSQGNEVIIPASGETAEDIARASAVEKSGVLLGGDLNILRPYGFINPSFLALAISSGEPQKELAKRAQGKSVVHIHNSDIQEVVISYPTRIEQDQIVTVFRHLDHLITLHQQKYDKYLQIKKAMLSELITGKIKLV